MKKLLLTAAAMLTVCAAAHAQVLLTTPTAGVYSQNFNSYAGTALSLPTGWTVGFSGTSTFSGAGTGTSATGGAWAYGTGADFAFGALRSGTPGNITLLGTFQNNTGETIDSLTLAWNYEQWRYANTSGLDLTATGALAGNATVDGKDFTGGAGTSGTVSSTPVASFLVSGLSIAPGATFGFSFFTTDDTGSDNGVAVDDFSLSYTTIPEPTTGIMLLGGAGMLMMLRRRHA